MANIAWVLRESDSAFGLCASEPPAARGEAALSPFIGGDCGIVADEDYIVHLGRRNELMNAGGFRVSSLEIEQELAKPAALGGSRLR